uniref:Uncharacterized protein n=1 Tax=viral metagenome TaxID=1070528 RepID=A0A6C0H5B0_9ZZZZ
MNKIINHSDYNIMFIVYLIEILTLYYANNHIRIIKFEHYNELINIILVDMIILLLFIPFKFVKN